MNLNLKDFGKGGFFGFLVTSVIIAILAYANGGAFSLGILSANFATDTEILKSENTQLNELVINLESRLAALEGENLALKKQLSSSELIPINQFNTSLSSFIKKYGDIKTSMVDISCENDTTKRFRVMKRELAILKAKALELDLLTSYKQFFDSFTGMTMSGSC